MSILVAREPGFRQIQRLLLEVPLDRLVHVKNGVVENFEMLGLRLQTGNLDRDVGGCNVRLNRRLRGVSVKQTPCVKCYT